MSLPNNAANQDAHRPASEAADVVLDEREYLLEIITTFELCEESVAKTAAGCVREAADWLLSAEHILRGIPIPDPFISLPASLFDCTILRRLRTRAVKAGNQEWIDIIDDNLHDVVSARRKQAPRPPDE